MYIENENLAQIKPRNKRNNCGTLNWKRRELCNISIITLCVSSGMWAKSLNLMSSYELKPTKIWLI